MLVKVRAGLEAFRSSLFFVPLLFVLIAAAMAQITLAIDSGLDGEDLPDTLRTTVDSARNLLGTLATATITVAGVAFSISLLVVQLASTQYSPRVLQTFYRDGFTKRTIGIVVGVFTYSLLVLRVVRGPINDNGDDVIPYLSVVVALVLGVVAILAILAFINHSAHTMAADEIIRRIAADTRSQIEVMTPDPEEGAAAAMPELPDPPDDAFIVTATRDGWVQQLEPDDLLDAVPEGGTVLLHVRPGSFVPEGLPLCTLWPGPDDEERREEVRREVWEAIRQGAARTLYQDVEFGIRQLVDVALRALSPSENDPTTAEQVIEHLAAVMKDLLSRDLPPRYHEDDDRRQLFRLADPAHQDHVDVAYDQIRRVAASHPSVIMTLLRSLGPVVRFLDQAGLPRRAEMLRRKAVEAVRELEQQELLPEDAEAVRAVARQEELVGAGRP
jgi:uncharacterized membrane protein